MIDIACPACSASYKVPETLLGKSLKCKGCQASFVAAAALPTPASPFADLPASAPADAPGPTPEKPKGGRGKAIVLVGGAILGVLVVSSLLWFFVLGGVSWQEYTSKEGGFAVLVPGSPTPGKTNDEKMGVELKEIVAKPSKSGPTYTVQYADLREKPINDYLYLSWMKHKLLNEMKAGKLSEEQEIKLGSHTGRQVTLDLPDDQRLVRRMYLADQRIYLVTAQYPRTTGTEVEKFFDSFKITADPPKLAASRPTEPTTQIAKGPTPTMPVLPKATEKAGPVPTTKGPADPPPTPGNLTLSDEERGVVEQINQLRTADKKPAVQPDKEVFDAARAEASAQANKIPMPPHIFLGKNVVRVPVTARGVFTPQTLVDGLAKIEQNRRFLVDEVYQSIGVGIAKGADGTTVYLIMLVGTPKK